MKLGSNGENDGRRVDKKIDLSWAKALILVLLGTFGWAQVSQAAPLFEKDTTLSRHPNEPVEVSEYGLSVDIDRDTPLIGAHRKEAAYVFVRSGSGWAQQVKLIANDAGQFFGLSVAIDGDTIVAGRELDDDKGRNAGAAYVFIRGTDGWRQQAKLLARDGKEFDNFGRTVAIDRDTILVGAPRGDSAYVFVRRGDGWSQ